MLPFGLSNAPATFQQMVNDILRPYLGKFVLVYMDDILIYSRTLAEHEEHLRIILQLLRQEKLYAKESKCEFFKTKLKYLGHIVSNRGIEIDYNKVRKVREWPRPQTVRDVKSFIGFTGFFHRFILDYALIAIPLSNVLKGVKKKCSRRKSPPVVWTEEMNESFETLKHCVSTAPILHIVDPNKPFVVETDASDFVVGAVLYQDGRPIAFESKKLDSAQCRYSTYEKELFAVIHALKQWRHYLYGATFTVLTDHQSLKYICDVVDLRGRKARWSKLIQEFQFDIKYLIPNVRIPIIEADQGKVLIK